MDAPVEAPPEDVADLANGCIEYVSQAVGVTLDYTQDTLPVLDRYLELVPETVEEEVLGLVIPMCGAYFGEVVRRSLPGARWHAPDQDYESWRIEFDPCFLHFNPIGMALEAVIRDDAEGWSGHLQVLDVERDALRDALERLGEVPEDDYYRLALRFEVLEEAHAFLTSQSVAKGAQGRRFGRNVYQAVLDEEHEPDPMTS